MAGALRSRNGTSARRIMSSISKVDTLEPGEPLGMSSAGPLATAR
jgi:hypothetical protein